MFNEKSVVDFLKQQLQCFPEIKRWIVAVSGGVDSTVLLHLLAHHRTLFSVKLEAIHVHHGLHQEANKWQQHIEQQCHQLNIPIQSVQVKIKTQGESVEAKAREARYKAFEHIMDENSALLLAHHQDDQAETLLLQLFRGAGVKGLASMAMVDRFSKGILLRPLLNYSRDAILSYAMAQQLTWIYDDSNDDRRFDRNFLRHDIMPLLKTRWPAIDKTLARTANLCAKTNDLLQQIVQEKLQLCLKEDPYQLSISELKKFNEFEQHEILRAWFQQLNIAIPNNKHLKEITNLLYAKQNANPLVCWKDVSVRRYREILFVFIECAKEQSDVSISDANLVHFVLCPPYKKIRLSNNQQLISEKKMGGGISLEKLSTDIYVSFRNENGKRLKKIFQQFAIPPWQRPNTPLIFFKDKLIAVVGVWIHPAFKAKKDEEGIEFSIYKSQGETI